MIEVLLRVWKVGQPGARIAFRLLAVAFPVLVLPALVLTAPFRADDRFVEFVALSSVARYVDVRAGGLPVGASALALVSLTGLVLFARDVVPAVREHYHGVGLRARASSGAFDDRVAAVAARVGVAAPRVIVADSPDPILMCAGSRRPTIVVSDAALRILDANERDAALAHELSHIASHDTRLGWLLLFARTVACFNPIVQIAARAIVADMERRADDRAAMAVNNRAAMASAIAKLFAAERPIVPVAGSATRENGATGFLEIARLSGIEARVGRMAQAAGPAPMPLFAFRFAIAAAGVLALVFFAA